MVMAVKRRWRQPPRLSMPCIGVRQPRVLVILRPPLGRRLPSRPARDHARRSSVRCAAFKVSRQVRVRVALNGGPPLFGFDRPVSVRRVPMSESVWVGRSLFSSCAGFTATTAQQLAQRQSSRGTASRNRSSCQPMRSLGRYRGVVVRRRGGRWRPWACGRLEVVGECQSGLGRRVLVGR